VLFLGAWNEKKGAIPFLKAALRSEARQRGAVFAMTGTFTANDREFARRWDDVLGEAQRQLPPMQLELTGSLAPAEVIRQVRRARVVVVPSLFDEWARVVLEALLLARPVITTETVGAASLVREHGAGLVVPPDDVAALAAAIDDALRPDAPYLARAREAAPKLREQFSSQAIAVRMAGHLDDIARPLP
jgi:glycosyltransferase involved in cell wall biosynthesis